MINIKASKTTNNIEVTTKRGEVLHGIESIEILPLKVHQTIKAVVTFDCVSLDLKNIEAAIKLIKND